MPPRFDKVARIGPGLLLLGIGAAPALADHVAKPSKANISEAVQLGPRPYYLVDDMDDSALKRKLKSCAAGPFAASDFSIGHRGAALQFPEHTKESYLAAARMGAGVLECDVTFTKDRELVCRHSQCDLHTTTDILSRPALAAKCSQPFTPAKYDANGNLLNAASARCCTSDITLDEFRSLCGKMDASNPNATNVADYLAGTANRHTGLYSTCGTVLSHKDSIRLFKKLGVKMIPELKSPDVSMPFEGDFTQENYAQQMIDEYKSARVPARLVRPQSFNLDDVRYWIENEPNFGIQAVFLDGRYGDPDFNHTKPDTWKPDMKELADMGVNIIAPPMWMLLEENHDGRIIPSVYAGKARAAGLDIITWTIERSGPLKEGGGWHYQTLNGSNGGRGTGTINNDGDVLSVLDVLARDVGVIGVFSDWPATVSYYANCLDPLNEGLGPDRRHQRQHKRKGEH